MTVIFKWLKRVSIAFFVILIISVCCWPIGVRYLKNLGITYSSLKITFPLEISVQNLSIELIDEGFSLQLHNCEFDLNLKDLFSAQLSGNSFKASGLKIRTFPASLSTTIVNDTTKFSYSIIPFLKFNTVNVDSVDLAFFTDTDSTIIQSSNIQAYNLTFNDSIKTDALFYNSGRLNILLHTDSTQIPVSEPFYLTEYMPYFNATKFVVHDLDFKVETDGTPLCINKINCRATAINHKAGMNLDPDYLNCILQDTLFANINSKRFTLKSIDGGNIDKLTLNAPGLALNIEDLKTLGGVDGSLHSLSLKKSQISPQLIEVFTGKNNLFSDNCKNLLINGDVVLKNDTISLTNFYFCINQGLNGYVDGYTNINSSEIHFKLKSILINSEGIRNAFDFSIPKELNHISSITTAEVNGTIAEPEFILNSNVNSIPIYIKGQIKKGPFNNSNLTLQLKVNKFNLMENVPDLNQELTVYNLNLKTTLNINKLPDLKQIQAQINADTLQYLGYKLIQPDFSLRSNNNKLTMLAQSDRQNWSLEITTSDNPLKSSDVAFMGSYQIEMINLENTNQKTGIHSANFNGNVKLSKDFTSVHLMFDTLLFKPINSRQRFVTQAKLSFIENKGDYAISFCSDSTQHIDFSFNDSLMNYLKNPSLKKNFPDFNFKAKLNIDSNFFASFTGIPGYLKINSINATSLNHNTNIKMDIPEIKYKTYRLDSTIFQFSAGQSNKSTELFINSFTFNNFSLNHIINKNTADNLDSINIYLSGNLKDPTQHLDLHSILINNHDEYIFKLNPIKEIHLGDSIWTSVDNKGIRFNKSNSKINGRIGIKNKEQKLEFNSDGVTFTLITDSLKAGPIISSFFKSSILDAYVNLKADYNQNKESLELSGNLNNIIIDSVFFGEANLNFSSFQNKNKLNLNLQSIAGNAIVYGRNEGSDFNVNLKFNNVNIHRIDTTFKLTNNLIDVKGKINGEINAQYGSTQDIRGKVKLDNIQIELADYGFNSSIKNQELIINNNKILFSDFLLENNLNEKLIINGSAYLFGNDSLDLFIKSNNYSVINSDKPGKTVKGNLKLNSNLKINGTRNKIMVSGDINVPSGGDVEYYHKGNVSLNETDNTVIFKNFKLDEEKNKKPNNFNKLQINYNVKVDVGSTNLYILLSKTHQEYVRMSPSGNLKLISGNGSIPNAFGKLESNEGKVYYEAPLIQNIELEIVKALVSWNGSLDNPLITFKGKETFRVTPNEISAELKNKTERVPVVVTTSINEKTLKGFNVNFNLSSESSEIQNLINSLPEETRENYAINMLLFGKINRDADKSTSSLDNVVNKMNEISRRNIKNGELTFHVDNTNEEKPNSTESQNKIGYNFSKGFFNKKLNISVGGNLGLNQTVQTENSKNSLINNIQLKYIIKEDPQLFIQLCRASNYKGPFEGMVDESSFGFGYNLEHRNLFKRKAAK